MLRGRLVWVLEAMSARRLGRCTALGLSAWLLAACAASPAIQAPRVELVGITVQPAAAGSSRFRANLLVTNPNAEPLPISQLRFSVRLAGEGLLIGALPAPVVVPASDRQTLTLDVDSELVSSLSRLLGFAQGPQATLAYEIVGNLILDRRMREAFAINGSGQVPLTAPLAR